MEKKNHELLKNFSFSVGANVISLFVSAVMVFVAPKLIGVEDYSYWQLYLFYSNYVGFFHIGWCDGLYLRYGGYDYKSINKQVFCNQFWLLALVQIVISIILLLFVINYTEDISKLIVITITILSIAIVITKTYISYVLQATNRIRDYSILLTSEKLIFLFLVLGSFLFKMHSFIPLIISDFIGKLIALIIGVMMCKKIVFNRFGNWLLTFKEIKLNLLAGSKLMFANIAGMLIIGIVRMSIENNWSIVVFGKVSLSLSVSNMLMVFINAIGIVIFPMLKRSSGDEMKKFYGSSRNILMVFIFAVLLFYYPFQRILSLWLPHYADSLQYMAILFPICVFETKMSLLINTYLKALRKEKVLLFCNVIAVILSVILSIISVFILNNLQLAIFSIVILSAFRCVISECILGKFLENKLSKDILFEMFLVIVFVVSGWYIKGLLGFAIYFITFLGYLLFKRNTLKTLYLKFSLIKK